MIGSDGCTDAQCTTAVFAGVRKVHCFLEILGSKVVWWRPSNETLVRHRNPIWDPRLGIMPSTSLVVDTLHTLDLGVMKNYCAYMMWFLINSGVWGQGRATESEQVLVAVGQIRKMLLVWYGVHHTAFPNDRLTQLQDLTIKMLGNKNRRTLKTKGAETWGVLLFIVFTLKRYGAVLGAVCPRLLAAGEALVKLVVPCNVRESI